MEPGLIAMMVCMGVGSVVVLVAIATHVFEWRVTAQKREKEKEDLEKLQSTEKSAVATTQLKTPPTPIDKTKQVSVRPPNTKKRWLGYSTLKSPVTSASPISSTRPTSASFGDILVITSAQATAGNCPSLVQSPISECSITSPLTPNTPYTPITPPPMAFRPLKTSQSPPSAARPLLAPPSTIQAQFSPPQSSYCEDPYTHIAPRVMGSRIRRYATPPRHLRVTIPDRNTKPSQHSHRRLPSDFVITEPPRVLARSISELVGGDGPDEESPRSREAACVAKHDLLSNDRNLNEVGRLGW